MRFEFDPAKSEANKAKHGIDFVEAQALWCPGMGVSTKAHSLSETRYGIIGVIDQKYWVGYFTIREGVVRIISVRRAREVEKRAYEDNHGRGTR